MAFGSTNGSKRLVSDINVTPLVDVMLVLLIIFMVTAPMMTQGVDVDLPETTAKPLRQKEEPLLVTIRKDGQIYFNNINLDQTLLKQQLNGLSKSEHEKPIFLKADKQHALLEIFGVDGEYGRHLRRQTTVAHPSTD